MRKLGASGGDTFLNITTPKFSAQAIAAVAKSDWKPLHILNNVGASKKLVLEPVGLENAKDIVSMTYFKDPEDPQWADDAAMKEYKAGMAEHEPKADPLEAFCAYGWTAASTMIEALKAMKEPTREALMEPCATWTSRSRCCCRASRSRPRRTTASRSRPPRS